MEHEPESLVVDNIPDKISDSPFGERWGRQVIRLTPEQLHLLREGKFLAVDVQGEYVVYLGVTEHGA